MDEWIAFEELEPDSLLLILETLKIGFCALYTAWGGSAVPDDFSSKQEWIPLEEQEPDTPRAKASGEMSPEQQAMAFAMSVGRPPDVYSNRRPDSQAERPDPTV